MMNQQSKDILFIICIILVMVSLILAIVSGVKLRKERTKLQVEMAVRFDKEEQLENSKFVISALEEEIRKLGIRLDAEKLDKQNIITELEEEKMVGSALKEELFKTTKLKESLENSLKEVLSAGPAKNSK